MFWVCRQQGLLVGDALNFLETGEAVTYLLECRLAQIGNAALPGVEGLAVGQRPFGGAGYKIGRRQVAFADPERDQAGLEPAVIDDLDDAAQKIVAAVKGGK